MMRALFFDNNLRYLTDYLVPEPGENEALIRVTCAGICNTDLEIVKGYMNFRGVPGHEFVGVVERCGNKALEGKRVVGEINLSCGNCPYCKSGLRNHCYNRSVLWILGKDGVFADYVTLPTENLHLVPDSVPDEEAVFVEPLAAAFEILEQVKIGPGDRVCVLGDGKLGLLVAQVVSLTGCALVVGGRHKEKLSILERRGIETRLSSDITERVFDCVIDCTGSPSGIEAAMKLVRPKGTIVLKTTVAKRDNIDMNAIVIDEITLVGSRCGPFEPAIQALEMKTVDVIHLISRTFPLSEGVEAFNFASGKGILKVLLKR